jgi:hypothetical protein
MQMRRENNSYGAHLQGFLGTIKDRGGLKSFASKVIAQANQDRNVP